MAKLSEIKDDFIENTDILSKRKQRYLELGKLLFESGRKEVEKR